MDLKFHRYNSRFLSHLSGDESITSNLAHDPYQSLLAISYSNGIVEIFDIKSERKTKNIHIQKLGIKGTVPTITQIKFYPNRPFLLALDILNVLHLINYQTNDVSIIKESEGSSLEISKIYIP